MFFCPDGLCYVVQPTLGLSKMMLACCFLSFAFAKFLAKVAQFLDFLDQATNKNRNSAANSLIFNAIVRLLALC
jgi:hypothetical protein